MRTTQAIVRVHDDLARSRGEPLPEVRYDLVDSQAAEQHGEVLPPRNPTWSRRVTLSRSWLQRRTGLTGRALLDLEERIDMAVVERLEKGVATTCGGIL